EVVEREGISQERVIPQIDHPQAEVEGGPPVFVHPAELVRGQRRALDRRAGFSVGAQGLTVGRCGRCGGHGCLRVRRVSVRVRASLPWGCPVGASGRLRRPGTHSAATWRVLEGLRYGLPEGPARRTGPRGTRPAASLPVRAQGGGPTRR